MFNKQATIFFAFLCSMFVVPQVAFGISSDDPLPLQWGYVDIGITEAWNYTIGSRDVIVAVIDNGFDLNHPDIRENVWHNTDEIPNNGIDDDKNGYIDDTVGWNFSPYDADNDGNFSEEELFGTNNPQPDVSDLTDLERAQGIIHHGTLVAGIIGARGNNNIGGRGLNWQVQLMNLKVVDNSGSGPAQPLSRAIRYAVDNGADVINISLVSRVAREAVRDALLYAYEHNVVVVAAVGNNGILLDDNPMYPACMDVDDDFQFVLGVSAINAEHYLAPFSNAGNCVDITAPGVDISGPIRYEPVYGLDLLYDSGYQGTSFASPFVAGSAALIRSLQPNWTVDRVYDVLLDNVHRTPPADVELYQTLYGSGLLQTNKAVKYAAERSKIRISPDDIKPYEAPSVPETQDVEPSTPTTDTRPETTTVTPTGGVGTILSIQKTSGLINTRDIATGKESSFFSSVLKSADGVEVLEEDGSYLYIVTRLDDDGKNTRVSFFNDNWAKVREFTVQTGGPVDIHIADVDPMIGYEIILSPLTAADYTFMILDENGVLLTTKKISYTHNGVSLAVVSQADKKDKIVVTHVNESNQLYLYEYEGVVSKNSFAIDFITQNASVQTGDIDGDGELEYIIGAPAGQIPYLAFFEQNGDLLRKFYAYDPMFNGGLSLAVIDYDGNGTDDVLITHRTGGMPVRIWTQSTKRLLDFYPFGEKNTHDIILKTF